MILLTHKNDLNKVLYIYKIKNIKESFVLRGGIINKTFYVKDCLGRKFVIQKVNKMFSPILMKDIRIISKYLRKNGWICSTLVNLKNGRLFYRQKGNILWRVYNYIEGKSFDSSNIYPNIYRDVGKLLGKFHSDLNLCVYKTEHILKGFHQKNFYIEKARNIIKSGCAENIKKLLENVISEISGNVKYPFR